MLSGGALGELRGRQIRGQDVRVSMPTKGRVVGISDQALLARSRRCEATPEIDESGPEDSGRYM
jgi:hypothetical protein